MRLLGVEGEDLPRHLALGHHQRRDCPGAQTAHRFQAVAAVRRPEALLRRGDRDHRIEEHAGAVEHVGEPLVMHLRQIALERRRLDRLDRQHRED